MSGDHPNNSIIENGSNTEKSPGDLRRLAGTQTPGKNHQLKLMWKTLKETYKYFGILEVNTFKPEENWMRLRKGKLMRETESLLIAVQNNAIRTIYIKARIDRMQQNNKCQLCGDRDKTINHIISECSKLTQEEY